MNAAAAEVIGRYAVRLRQSLTTSEFRVEWPAIFRTSCGLCPCANPRDGSGKLFGDGRDCSIPTHQGVALLWLHVSRHSDLPAWHWMSAATGRRDCIPKGMIDFDQRRTKRLVVFVKTIGNKPSGGVLCIENLLQWLECR
jgi:hypothetical protein